MGILRLRIYPEVMSKRWSISLLSLLPCLLLGWASNGQAQQSQDKASYSFARGVSALAETTQNWRTEHECISCHTTGWGLAAQPTIAPRSKEVALGRRFAQDYMLKGIVKDAPAEYSVEVLVSTAAFLAMSDARSGRKIHAATKRGLDHAWTLLDESGTWEDWLQCNWPPFESDVEFGPTLMLVALGELRESAPLRATDLEGAKKLAAYLQKTPPLSLHAKAMRLWAGSAWPNSLPDDQRAGWRKELVEAQAADGGWSMAALSGPAWKRDDGAGQLKTSEAYPTAFSTYVLLQTGASRKDELILKALHWLRADQRAGGEWFTRSPRRDRHHYISRTATAFALMALAE